MSNKKVILSNFKTRADISNPYHKLSHDALLRIAGVEVFNGNYHVQQLCNGRIIVEAKSIINKS